MGSTQQPEGEIVDIAYGNVVKHVHGLLHRWLGSIDDELGASGKQFY